MIPEVFKKDVNIAIKIFDFDVNVDYVFHWPNRKGNGRDPSVVHFEFRSDSAFISPTGYHSHFLHSAFLHDCNYSSIEELARALGEHLARENGYTPPHAEQQLSLF